MKKIVFIFLSLGLLCCHSNQNKQKNEADLHTNLQQACDTIIDRINVTNEVAGAAYIMKANEYFVILKEDTSLFKPIFLELNDGGKVEINLNLPYSNKTETYSQKLMELKVILPEAAKEFNLDSLTSMSVGRLILTGDLAVEITKEFSKVFGQNRNITTADYREISEFLLKSKLAEDLNELFKPYSKTVQKIVIEKAFFTTKDDLLHNSKVSADTVSIPDKILDCITWIRFTCETH